MSRNLDHKVALPLDFFIFSEETQKFQVFCENMEKIEAFQKMEQGTAQYGVTEFADLSGKLG